MRLQDHGQFTAPNSAPNIFMKTARTFEKRRSWRDQRIGMGLLAEDNKKILTLQEDDEELDLREEDITRSSVNGVPPINFSE